MSRVAPAHQAALDLRPPFRATGEQEAAIRHPLAALLVMAGAGSGKTSVMAERVLHLVREGLCADHEVLALTFTNKAAAHLKETLRRRLPGADVTVATYHSFGASLVAAHPVELGLDPATQILNRAQAWQLLFTVFDEFRFERRKVAARPGLVVDHALALAARCADHLVPVAVVAADSEEVATQAPWQPAREAAAARAELCQVVEAYERRKRERNLLDYGDQIALAVRLLRDHPEVAGAYRAQHPVAVLDEYQDTNYAQRVLLQLLDPPGSAVTAVGDDMQSIYAFRGAHLENILRFDEHFPPAARLPLTVNFRSGPAIVELANRIQGQVRESLPKQLVPRPGAPPDAIECFLAADEAEEAAEIARSIEARGRPWSGVAVLCRKRRLIPAIADALDARGIPVHVVGASGLLDRPEVVDLVAWLELLHDLSASVALVRILEGPRYRIGFRDLAALARHARRLAEGERADWPASPPGGRDDASSYALADALADLAAVPDLSPEARARLAAFWAERAELSAAATRLPVLDLCETVVERTGLWGAVDRRGHENLLRFLDLAASFAPVEGDAGLPAFIEYLHLLDETEEDVAEAHPTDDDAVRVMTIHQAKGLEFPVVYVPGLAGRRGSSRLFPDNRAGENALSSAAALPWWLRADDEGFPHWRRAASKQAVDELVRARKLDEEWRLLYVACTRAQERLVCSAAQWYPGTAEPQGPSPFYDFLVAQTDLVAERFRREPPGTDPTVAGRARRLEALRARLDSQGGPVPWDGVQQPPLDEKIGRAHV
jgi:DNA helicase-2/ATP-dependent DNA helicase PcrA